MRSDILDGGPFTASDAEAHGLSRNELWRLCERGQLLRPSRGLYLPARLASDFDARAAAVGLILPRGAAVSRESAAWLLGVDVRPPARWTDPPLLECLVPAGTTPPRRPGLRAFASALPPDDIIVVGNVRCTSPVRTALDLARYRAEHVGLASLDAFLFRQFVTKDELIAAVEKLDGRRYAARARRLVDLSEPGVESPGESWCRLRLVECGLPRPEVQVSVRDGDGVEIYRIDMGYPEERVGIEYDGFEFHHRTQAQETRDGARRADLLARFGWRVTGFMAGHVLGRRPYVENAAMEMLGISREIRRRPWE